MSAAYKEPGGRKPHHLPHHFRCEREVLKAYHRPAVWEDKPQRSYSGRNPRPRGVFSWRSGWVRCRLLPVQLQVQSASARCLLLAQRCSLRTRCVDACAGSQPRSSGAGGSFSHKNAFGSPAPAASGCGASSSGCGASSRGLCT